MSEHETYPPIENHQVAKAFQLEYDDFIDRQAPLKLAKNLLASAKESADGSVLAASVVAHVKFFGDGGAHDGADYKKATFEAAGLAAKSVKELDAFLRDPEHRTEPVIYAEQNYKEHGVTPDHLSVHFTVADGSKLTVKSRDRDNKPWYRIFPKAQYGVQSPVIGHGKVYSQWLQGTRAYGRGNLSWHDEFNMYMSFGYPDITKLATWHDAYNLPSFTLGTNQLLEVYTRVIAEDATDGYTEHRYRRAGHLLMRQAFYMEHPVYNDLVAIAEKAQLLPVWRRQCADDVALSALGLIQNAAQKNKVIVENFELLRFADVTDEEMATLSVDRKAVEKQLRKHARLRGVDASRRTIGIVLDKMLDDD